MAAMSTSLTEFSTNGDSRTWTTSGHTVSKPKLVLQKRRVPVGNQTIAETTISVIHAAADSTGAVLPSKVNMSVTVRTPLGIDSGDTAVADALAILKDIVGSDEFASTVSTQNFLDA
jgi:hypothetical protein